MEYPLALNHLPAPPNAFALEEVTEQEPSKDSNKKNQDDYALLAGRLRELEEQIEESQRSFQQKLEIETAAAFERGRVEEGSHRTAAITEMTQVLKRAVGEFASERDRYLEQVEQEVVRLALSIAARILHREAQMDPLLLSGAVRVALGQLSDVTEVRLRIPAAQQQLWAEMVHLMPNLPLRPQLVADDALGAGECLLETHLGAVDLGVKAQLKEIERGFFDLLEQREPARREVRAVARTEEV
jgi:flagellar assembly protein FliH